MRLFSIRNPESVLWNPLGITVSTNLQKYKARLYETPFNRAAREERWAAIDERIESPYKLAQRTRPEAAQRQMISLSDAASERPAARVWKRMMGWARDMMIETFKERSSN